MGYRSRRRPSTWCIEERDNGSFDVTRGNRTMTTGLRSVFAARNIVGQHRQPGERVYLVEPDGYRTELRL